MTGSLLVLGATGAVGSRIVDAALDAGRAVIAVARNGGALDALRVRHAEAPLRTLAASLDTDAGAAALAADVNALGLPLAGVIAAVRGDIERGRLLDAPADFLRRRLDEDLMPHLFAARHLLPLLAAHGQGGYVLIGGPGAEQPWAGYGHYSIGAAALRMLARVLRDEARAFPVRVQLLAIDSPVRTAANARHACSQWPDVDAIARRALAMVDDGLPRADAVVRYSEHRAPTALWSDDIDADLPRTSPGSRTPLATDASAISACAAHESDGADDIATRRSLIDARNLLRAITASSHYQEIPSP